MAEYQLNFATQLDKKLEYTNIEGMLAFGDVEAHRITVRLYKGGAAYEPDGTATVAGYVLRADGNTVLTDTSKNTIVGNAASVVLPQEAYAVTGHAVITLRITETGGAKTTIFAGRCFIAQTTTDDYIDPGTVIPDIDTLLNQIAALEATTGAARAVVKSSQGTIGYFNYNALEPRQGNIASSTGKWTNVTSVKYNHVLMPVESGQEIAATVNSSRSMFYAFLTSAAEPVASEAAPLLDGTSVTQKSAGVSWTATVPSGAHYLYMTKLYNEVDTTPAALTIDGVNCLKNVVETMNTLASGISDNAADIAALDTRVTALEDTDAVNWCAMGDSITYGWYSSKDWVVNPDEEGGGHYAGVGHATPYTGGWAYRVARARGWTLTNIAVGGTGFINPKNGTESGTPSEQARGWWLARNTDFSGYDLITVAYGINDYNGYEPIGELNDPNEDLTAPTTIYGAIQSLIEGIMATAVKAKLIMITPLNARGYKNEQGQDTRGNYASNYALGHSLTGPGTLKDVRDAIIACCEYYGIEYIDMSYSSVINRLTLQKDMDGFAPDGVHPSLTAHALLARELGDKIHFGHAGTLST